MEATISEIRSKTKTDTKQKMMIGELPLNSRCRPIYKRMNGDTYMKLNNDFHIKAEFDSTDNTWFQSGAEAVTFDASEMVEVIRLAEPIPETRPNSAFSLMIGIIIILLLITAGVIIHLK